MANDNIFVLVFSSDGYSLEELNAMTSAERYDLAIMCKMLDDYAGDVLTLQEFEDLFNNDRFNADNNYLFFHVIG